MFVAFCPELMQAIYSIGPVSRGDLTGDLDLTSFAGKIIETWIGFISPDGRDIATSIFTGEITVS